MIVGAIATIVCSYVFGQEMHEKQQKRTHRLAKKLNTTGGSKTKEETSIQQQITELVAPFIGDNLPDQAAEKSEEEKEIDQHLSVSAASLGLAVAALVFPPVRLLAIGGLVYCTIPLYKASYISLFKKRKVDADVIDTVALTGALAKGYLVASAIGELFYFGSKKLLLKTEDHSTKKLINLYGDQPKFVWLVKDNTEIEIPFEKLEKGNIISVHAGSTIPIDGEIVKGYALVNQQTLTGEAQAVEKVVGATCFAATFIIEGYLHIEVQKTGQETVVAQIGEVLHKTIDFKEVMISKGQEVADDSSLPALAISAAAIPYLGVVSAVAITNAFFGYILKMTSPMMVLNFLSITSQEGILIKDGRSLERLNKIDTVVFDKTGTLTFAQPHVGKIHSLNNYSEEEILLYTAAAEHRQTHPIALAILEAAKDRQLNLPEVEEAKYEIGYGIKVNLSETSVHVGSARFMEMENINVPNHLDTLTKNARDKGYSFVYVAINGQLEGMIELHPTIRPEATAIIQELQATGKTCYIISGDHEYPTRHLAQQLGIDHYFAEVLPEDKADLVAGLQKENRTVCFIGDGINDAIALKKADVSVSLQGASTIATDTAQIVLMTESLKQLPLLFTIGDHFKQHMETNVVSTVVPAIFAMGGVFFFQFGISAAIVISQIGLAAGIGNAMHPMLTYQQAKYKKQELVEAESQLLN